MEKIIKMGDKEVKLNNNMAWTMEYRDQFDKDIIPVMMPMVSSILEAIASVFSGKNGTVTMSEILESIEGRTMDILIPMYQAEFTDIVIGITWAMAKAADDSIDPPKKWIRQFDVFPLDIVVPEVFDLAVKGAMSANFLKKLEGIKGNLKTLQPSPSMTSSSLDSNED